MIPISTTRNSAPTLQLTLELTPAQHAQLKTLARRKRTSQKRALLELLAEAVDVSSPPQTLYDRFKDHLEQLEADPTSPGDLSTNKDRLKPYVQAAGHR